MNQTEYLFDRSDRDWAWGPVRYANKVPDDGYLEFIPLVQARPLVWIGRWDAPRCAMASVCEGELCIVDVPNHVGLKIKQMVKGTTPQRHGETYGLILQLRRNCREYICRPLHPKPIPTFRAREIDRLEQELWNHGKRGEEFARKAKLRRRK